MSSSFLANSDICSEILCINSFILRFSSFNFKKGWKAEMWGFWNSPQQTLQGVNPSFSMYSFGFKKDLWNKRGSIGINIIDPFNKTKTFETDLEGVNPAGNSFTQNSSFGLPFRSFGINFSYKFGKLDFKAKSRKSSIKNDDMKQGEGEGQGGGGQGTGGGK